MKTFSTLGLAPPILEAILKQGYETPSPIQARVIPVIMEGKDVMAAAQTGTGKTAGFVLPILQQLGRRERAKANQASVLILTPTRELAAQVAESVAIYGKHLPLRSTAVFGGVKINPQMMKLRRGVDILVATPGRLLDLYKQGAVKFKQLETLVLDEADRMLDMGFIGDIRKIIGLLPKQRQNLMFSATFSKAVCTLAKGLLHQPVEVSVSPRNPTAQTVKQWICPADKGEKSALLAHLVQENQWMQVLVFMRTKHAADRLTRYLNKKDLKAMAIHGDKSQGARTKALREFKQGNCEILVATDVAARGLDIDLLPQVVNFDLPQVPEDYVHRIGRTGRAGAAGSAISLVSADEAKSLFAIERLIGQALPRELIDGFEPTHDIPLAQAHPRSTGAKKRRKPKVDHKDGQRAVKRARRRKK